MRDFEARIPLLKAEAQNDGSLRVAGVVSDESLDFAKERMPQGVLAEQSYDLLAKWGTINWRDHPRTSIGEVEFIGPITPEQAMAKYGQKIEGTGTEVVAKLHPIVDAAIAPEDLKEAHHAVRAGARLGWSVEGQYSKRRTAEGYVATSAIANRICLTDQPVNLNTVARPLYKSIGAIEGDIDEAAADGLSQAPDAPPVPLVVYAPVADFTFTDTAPLAKTFTADDISDEVVEELLKALEGGAPCTDVAAKTGGQAIMDQSLDGVKPKKRRRTTKRKRIPNEGKE